MPLLLRRGRDDDPEPEREPTRLFNRSTDKLVHPDGWGHGVVLPGESFLTDTPEAYAPDLPGSPWTIDEEAATVVALTELSTLSFTEPDLPDLAISPAPDNEPAEAGNEPSPEVGDNQEGTA